MPVHSLPSSLPHSDSQQDSSECVNLSRAETLQEKQTPQHHRNWGWVGAGFRSSPPGGRGMSRQEPCSPWAGWGPGADQRCLGSPRGDQPSGSLTLLLLLFGGKGISEQIFVPKGKLGWPQESQIIERYDLSLLMFLRHGQCVSKCFPGCLGRLGPHGRGLAVVHRWDAGGPGQPPLGLPGDGPLGRQPSLPRGRWAGGQDRLR